MYFIIFAHLITTITFHSECITLCSYIKGICQGCKRKCSAYFPEQFSDMSPFCHYFWNGLRLHLVASNIVFKYERGISQDHLHVRICADKQFWTDDRPISNCFCQQNWGSYIWYVRRGFVTYHGGLPSTLRSINKFISI